MAARANSRCDGSTRSRRAMPAGRTQFQRPKSETVAGTSSARMIVASSRITRRRRSSGCCASSSATRSSSCASSCRRASSTSTRAECRSPTRRMTPAGARRSSERARPWGWSSTNQPAPSSRICCRSSSRRAGWRSRSHGCASSCGAGSRRSRLLERASCSAGYEERRRLERDLHDGAQQRLVSIGLALRHAQHELAASSPGQVSATLDDAVAELARGDRRAARAGTTACRLRSSTRGLALALRELAGRVPLPVELEVSGRTRRARRRGRRVLRRLRRADQRRQARRAIEGAPQRSATNGTLVVRVADDGIGGAATSAGSGPEPASRTASPLTAARCASRAPLGAGTTLDRGAAVRVVIAEDQVLLREGLARLFVDSGHEVVAAMGDADRCCSRSPTPPGPRGHRHPDAADVHRRGRAGRAARSSRRIPRSACSSSRSTSRPRTRSSWSTPGRLRLPAQGPGARRRRLPRCRRARRRTAAPRSTRRSSRRLLSPPREPRSARRPLRARARGARADGRGPHEHRHRQAPLPQRAHRRGARAARAHQARPAARARTATAACSPCSTI